MIIYKTTNHINGKAYVGLHNGNDPKYLGSGTIIKQALKKYGRANFSRETLEECSCDEELRLRESYWIDKLDAINSDMFYNIAPGGRGGYCGVKIDRVKLSKSVKATWNNYTPEKKQSRLDKSNWGKYDKTGSNNPKAKSIIVEDELGVHQFECIKDYASSRGYPYSAIKGLFLKFKNSEYKNNNVRGLYTNIIAIREYHGI